MFNESQYSPKTLQAKERNKHISNLYTSLQGFTKDDQPFLITADDIILLTRNIFLKKIKQHEAEENGKGTKGDPFILDNPILWSLTAANLKSSDKKSYQYFRINNELFSVNILNKYMAHIPNCTLDKTHNLLAA